MKNTASIIVIISALLSIGYGHVFGADPYTDLVMAERTYRFQNPDNGAVFWPSAPSLFAPRGDSVIPLSIDRNLLEMLHGLGYAPGRDDRTGRNNDDDTVPVPLTNGLAVMLEYLGYAPGGFSPTLTDRRGRTMYASAATSTSIQDIGKTVSDLRGNRLRDRDKAPKPVKPAVARMLKHLGYRF